MNLQIDFQIHTNHSPSCGWMAPETAVQRADRIGLDGIAITDHNTMSAVVSARNVASEDLLVVPGEEIDTPEGQLIGLFLSDTIDPWQSPGTVINEIHEQGGIVLTPHPFDSIREGLTTIADYVEMIDVVETLNSRCVRRRYNERAQAFVKKHQLPATGGSDAHFAHEIGTAYTQVQIDSETTDEINRLSAVKDALRAGHVTPAGKTGSLLAHAGTKGVKLYNRVRQR